MVYDIELACAGLVFMIVLFVFLRIQYDRKSESTLVLTKLLLFLIIADTVDIITCYTISFPNMVPVWLNYVLNILYFEFSVICISLFPKYIDKIIGRYKSSFYVVEKFNKYIIWSYAVICATTPFTHSIFYFDSEMKYTHGSLYLLIYLLPMYFMIYSLIELNQYKKHFRRRQFVSIIGFVLCAISGPVLQMTIPGNKIIDFFMLSLASFIAVIGLETPDFVRLQNTLEELELHKEMLENASRAKSDFLANMSHEIRTPINAILGMNELITRESNEDNILSYSSNISDSGTTLLGLINDILDFSKIEAGRMELALADYKLSVLIREVYHLLKMRFDAKGLAFEVSVNSDIPDNLYGDEVRIRQILVNILTNALKYTDSGSVKLDVSYEKTNDDSITLIFTSTDTGIGIKEENLSHLFESFKRIDMKHNRKREGTGLGLSITKSFIDMMEGHIDVTSEYGKGSVFTIKIPQLVNSEETIGEFEVSSAPVKKKKYVATFKAPNARILVVDDVMMNLIVFKGLLKQTQITIDTVTSGSDCLEKIKRTPYDIIFLDHMMPEMDGIETLKYMKFNKEHVNQDTPVIMLTANAIIGAKDEYLKAGFNNYISKPVKSSELEAMIKSYLPASKLED